MFDLIIEKPFFDQPDSSKGNFHIIYKTNIFNGCSDLDLNEAKRMQIEFETDSGRNEILLKGEYFIERGQDEI